MDELGRTYYWNVDSNEVAWTRPVEVKAISDIAAGAAHLSATHLPACCL